MRTGAVNYRVKNGIPLPVITRSSFPRYDGHGRLCQQQGLETAVGERADR